MRSLLVKAILTLGETLKKWHCLQFRTSCFPALPWTKMTTVLPNSKFSIIVTNGFLPLSNQITRWRELMRALNIIHMCNSIFSPKTFCFQKLGKKLHLGSTKSAVARNFALSRTRYTSRKLIWRVSKSTLSKK